MKRRVEREWSWIKLEQAGFPWLCRSQDVGQSMDGVNDPQPGYGETDDVQLV